jgi:hypothetical protein
VRPGAGEEDTHNFEDSCDKRNRRLRRLPKTPPILSVRVGMAFAR